MSGGRGPGLLLAAVLAGITACSLAPAHFPGAASSRPTFRSHDFLVVVARKGDTPVSLAAWHRWATRGRPG